VTAIVCAIAAALVLLPKLIGPRAKPNNDPQNTQGDFPLVPDNELQWQVPYDKKTGLASLYGDKPWLDNRWYQNWYERHAPAPQGKIVQVLEPTTNEGRSRGAVWTPGPGLAVSVQDHAPDVLIGDARALYALDILCSAANLRQLPLGRIYHTNPLDTAEEHAFGYAFEVFSDDAINKIIYAAQTLHMPIAWRGLPNESGEALLWQLRGGIKTAVGSTIGVQNRNVHYDLYLPRPDCAIQYIKHT